MCYSVCFLYLVDDFIADFVFYADDTNSDVIGVACGHKVFHCDWFIVQEPYK